MAFGKKEDGIAVIKPANIVRTTIKIKGTAPLVINKFSSKAREQMMETMSTPKNQKKAKSERPPRDYDKDFMGARHLSKDGWDGISAPAFRTALIDACRTAGLVMTKTKMAVFVIADGFDKNDGTPLVKIITKTDPERSEMPVRNESGVADIRVRPMWREWSCELKLEFDADMITPDSVVNLLDRAGKQVGVGEGRPFSKKSCGMGWGTFEVVTK
jgi:hypothetical protein